MKDLLRQVFARTIADLDPTHTMQRMASTSLLRQARHHPLLVVAFGKAARSMTNALVAALPGATMRGLVVPPEPDDAPLPPFEVIAGGHPLPTGGSMRAACRAIELAQSVRTDEIAVFLVSGGGSATFELPGDPAVTLDELRTLYGELVGSGAGIVAINTVRRHLSAVKGGRLALAASAAFAQLTLIVSDTPTPWNVGAVASGCTTPELTTIDDCRSVLDRLRLWPAVPPALRSRLQLGDLLPPMARDHELVRRITVVLVQDERDSRHFARRRLAHAGVAVFDDDTTDDWPYERAASHLLARLDRLRRRHPSHPVAIVAGGELSVPLPPSPGTGGRNQQFALACARRIRGRPITVLSCGTDGIDGNSPAAGAIVDGTTMARARRRSLDVHDALRRCDAFPLLHALADTVITGPTGTNVRDLRVLVHGS